MLDFEELTAKYDKSKTNLPILSGSPGNAEIVFDRIVKQANDSLSLFFGFYDKNFYSPIYPDTEICSAPNPIKPFIDFIERTGGEGVVNVISLSKYIPDLKDEKGIIGKLLSYYEKYGLESHLNLYKMLEDKKFEIDGNPINFLFPEEGMSYWFSTKNNRNNTDAVANFGDPKGNKKLREIFDYHMNANTQKVSLA